MANTNMYEETYELTYTGEQVQQKLDDVGSLVQTGDVADFAITNDKIAEHTIKGSKIDLSFLSTIKNHMSSDDVQANYGKLSNGIITLDFNDIVGENTSYSVVAGSNSIKIYNSPMSKSSTDSVSNVMYILYVAKINDYIVSQLTISLSDGKVYTRISNGIEDRVWYDWKCLNDISGEQIENGAITSTKIADGAITSTKIADGAIELAAMAELTKEKLLNINQTTVVDSFDSVPTDGIWMRVVNPIEKPAIDNQYLSCCLQPLVGGDVRMKVQLAMPLSGENLALYMRAFKESQNGIIVNTWTDWWSVGNSYAVCSDSADEYSKTAELIRGGSPSIGDIISVYFANGLNNIDTTLQIGDGKDYQITYDGVNGLDKLCNPPIDGKGVALLLLDTSTGVWILLNSMSTPLSQSQIGNSIYKLSDWTYEPFQGAASLIYFEVPDEISTGNVFYLYNDTPNDYTELLWDDEVKYILSRPIKSKEYAICVLTTKLHSTKPNIQDGYLFLLTTSSDNVVFAQCDTSIEIANKTARVTNRFNLVDGVIVNVCFTNGLKATYFSTLNINNTGAKSVVFNGSDRFTTISNFKTNLLGQDGMLSLRYDAVGGKYVVIGINTLSEISQLRQEFNSLVSKVDTITTNNVINNDIVIQASNIMTEDSDVGWKIVLNSISLGVPFYLYNDLVDTDILESYIGTYGTGYLVDDEARCIFDADISAGNYAYCIVSEFHKKPDSTKDYVHVICQAADLRDLIEKVYPTIS